MHVYWIKATNGRESCTNKWLNRNCSQWIPAGIWSLYNVGSTSLQRHDVASKLRRRCINVMCLLGICYSVISHNNKVIKLTTGGGCEGARGGLVERLNRSRVARKKLSDFMTNDCFFSAHARPFSKSTCLVLWLKFPFDLPLTWANNNGSGESTRMRRLAWTFVVRTVFTVCIRTYWSEQTM